MRALALLGARARIAELDAERDRIVAMFPELGKRRVSSPKKTGPSVLFDASDDESDDSLAPARAAADPAATKAKVLAMYTGPGRRSPKQIAAALGLTPRWISKIVRAARIEGTLPKLGRPPVEKKAKSDGPRARRSFDDAFKAKAVARVKAGETIAGVSRDLDISHSVVERWCKAAKVKSPRSTGITRTKESAQASASHRKWRPLHSDEIRETAVARVAAGETQVAVAADMKIPQGTIRNWAQAAAKKTNKKSDGE